MGKIQIALEGLLARNTQDQQRIRDVDSPESMRAPAEQESKPAGALTNTPTRLDHRPLYLGSASA
jgi:hypothetical protein